jgi:antirestriction protein ArdC
LKGNKRAFFSAAANARRAADVLHGLRHAHDKEETAALTA